MFIIVYLYDVYLYDVYLYDVSEMYQEKSMNIWEICLKGSRKNTQYISGWWFQPTPLKNDGVSWDDYSQYMESHNPVMFQPTNQICYIKFILSIDSPVFGGFPIDESQQSPNLIFHTSKSFFLVGNRHASSNPIINQPTNQSTNQS